MRQKTVITPRMKAINQVLFKECEGMDHCLIGRGRNIVLEVPRSEVAHVVRVLKESFPDVVDIRKAYLMLDDLHDFILVKPMITESPFDTLDSIPVPALEKQLVDQVADKEYASLPEHEKNRLFQSAFEVYDVNTSRLLRYAGRKGKKDEILSMISQLDTNRMQVIHKIQDVLSSTPVTKAWLFGSYSRMEERPDSDIDLLVDLDRQKNVGLFEIGKIALQLENAVGKAVDLVIDGAIKPFARESINHDKILIYERAV